MHKDNKQDSNVQLKDLIWALEIDGTPLRATYLQMSV